MSAELLKEFIEERSEYLVVQICPSIERAVAYLTKHQHKLDLIFMDIRLADGDSFEIFREMRVHVPVIFCTAFDQHALKAFKTNGIEYILKPFKQDDIHTALDKVETMRSSLTKGRSPDASYQKSILLRHRETMIPLQVSDIALMHLANEMVTVYDFKGRKHVLLKNLDDIESSLDPALFFRINRQMMVNRDAVQEIIPYFNRKVIVKLPFDIAQKAAVSRQKVRPFLEWMEKPE